MVAAKSGVRRIRVELGDRSYPIWVGAGARNLLPDCLRGVEPVSRIVVIADRAVVDLHFAHLLQVLPKAIVRLVVPPGEASKSLVMVEELSEQLADAKIDREAIIVAFGGGVAGDLAGFVAATWLRGVRFIQVPTTLLAAVDASVGGKTGVNLLAGKNLVGAFHQPSAVVIDLDFLQTLSDRDFSAGLAESIKHAAIRDPALLAWHETSVAAIQRRDPQVMTELVERNCRIKAEIVSRDEREAGLRAILNYGHTIGHAIEHLLEWELRHGECVALGMLVENELACARGWLGRPAAEQIRRLLAEFGLPATMPRELRADEICAACRVDKKVRAGAVNFVLLRELGRPERVTDISDQEIVAALGAIQAA